MPELWQLYNEQGDPIETQGASKDDVLSKGLLHGAAHVWIWREVAGSKEVLLQRRAADKRTFPNMLDISAAGHIDLGETPEQAAIREAQEEIGLTIEPSNLILVDRFHITMRANESSVENEFRWVYTLQALTDTNFKLAVDEVASTQWIPFDEFKQTVVPNNGNYVPQGDEYFQALLAALDKA